MRTGSGGGRGGEVTFAGVAVILAAILLTGGEIIVRPTYWVAASTAIYNSRCPYHFFDNVKKGDSYNYLDIARTEK